MRTSSNRLSLALVGGLLAACSSEAPAPIEDGVRVAVAPLTLPSLSKVCYDLRVTNAADGAGEVVWSKGTPGLNGGTPDGDAICSTEYGNRGGGDITYIGPCDADGQEDADPAGERTNSVTIWFDGLYDEGGAYLDPAGASGWQNPCVDATGAEIGCTLNVLCQENADALVEFNFTIMREANQGFFDVAVNFEDIFCSAKVDCVGSNGPLELLFDPATHTRGQTVVLGLACTAGATQAGQDPIETVLYRNPIVIDCGGAQTVLDPSAGPGNVYSATNPDPDPGDAIWQYATYMGAEALDCGTGAGSCSKRYWNVAIGFDPTTPACRLTTSATAAPSTGMTGFTTPDASAYPWIDVDVTLTGAEGGLVCAQHPLNREPAGVTTSYTSVTTSKTFCHRFDGELLTANLPECASDACSPALAGWSVAFGPADDYLYPYDVAANGAGNLAVAGALSNAVDFGGGALGPAGGYDAFVAKYSTSGQHLWSTRLVALGVDSWIEAYEVELDGAGHVVIQAEFRGAIEMGGTTYPEKANTRVLVAKLASADGSVLWSRVLDGFAADGNVWGSGLAVDSLGRVIVSGSYEENADLGGSPLFATGLGPAVYLARYLPDGTHDWSVTLGAGDYADTWQGLRVGVDDSITLTGWFQGTATFGGDSLDGLAGANFLVRFDGAGAHLWSTALDLGGERIVEIDVAADGDVVAVTQGALWSFDATGAQVWSEALVRPGGTAWLGGVSVAPGGAIAVTGSFEEPAIGLGGLGIISGSSSSSAFLAALDADGTGLWSVMASSRARVDNSFGASAQGLGVTHSATGEVVGLGYFRGDLDLGHGELARPGDGESIYLAKFPPSGLPSSCAPCAAGTFTASTGCSSCSALPNCAIVTCTSATDSVCLGCAAGFTLDAGACLPIDHCDGVTACDPGVCVSGTSGYTCDCPEGYSGDGAQACVAGWSRGFGPDATTFTPWDLASDGGNVACVTGEVAFAQSWGGLSIPAGAGQWDGYVACYDPATGAHQLSVRWPVLQAGGWLQGTAIAIDSQGDLVVAGQFSGSVQVGGVTIPAPTENGGRAFFLAKLDPAGVTQWLSVFQGADSLIHDIAIAANDAIVVTGRSRASVDFGGGPIGNAGDYDIFLARFDAAGQHISSQSFGGPGDDRGQAVLVMADGGVAITGSIHGTVSFGGADAISWGHADMFIASFDPAGAHRWSFRLGWAEGDDAGLGLALAPNGDVFFTGTFHFSDGRPLGYTGRLSPGDGQFMGSNINFGLKARSIAVSPSGLIAIAGQTPAGVAVTEVRTADINNPSVTWQVGSAHPNSDTIGVAWAAQEHLVATGYFVTNANFGHGNLANPGSGMHLFLFGFPSTGP